MSPLQRQPTLSGPFVLPHWNFRLVWIQDKITFEKVIHWVETKKTYIVQFPYDISSGARMWVRIPAWPVAALVSLSKTLNHNCFVLRMGREAVGPVCCVMHVKEPRTLIVKEKGLAPVFLDSRLEHPAGWICARYKSYHYYYYITS